MGNHTIHMPQRQQKADLGENVLTGGVILVVRHCGKVVGLESSYDAGFPTEVLCHDDGIVVAKQRLRQNAEQIE